MRLVRETCVRWFRSPERRARWKVESGARELPAVLPSRFRVLETDEYELVLTGHM